MVAAAELLLMRWSAHLVRGPHGEPLIPPLFVAEQGAAVRIADIRERDAATGVLGYIPGSVFPGLEGLERLVRDPIPNSPIVLVGANEGDAGMVARRLEELGVTHVAAMAGGLAAWRALGLSTSRDPAGVRTAPNRAPEPSGDSGPLTLEQVRAHVGDPRSVRWIKLASMIAHGRVSCIDGRDERGVIGSPGGDGGEFLLTLTAIERTTGKTLDEETVADGLLSQLDTFGDFYMHTDLLAFEALTSALRADPRLRDATTGLTRPEEWAEFLRSLPPTSVAGTFDSCCSTAKSTAPESSWLSPSCARSIAYGGTVHPNSI